MLPRVQCSTESLQARSRVSEIPEPTINGRSWRGMTSFFEQFRVTVSNSFQVQVNLLETAFSECLLEGLLWLAISGRRRNSLVARTGTGMKTEIQSHRRMKSRDGPPVYDNKYNGYARKKICILIVPFLVV